MTKPILIAYLAALFAQPFIAGAVAGLTPQRTIAELAGMLAHAAALGVRLGGG